MEERTVTKHPEPGKRGVSIDKAKYDLIRASIMESLRRQEGLTYTELARAVEKGLEGKFDGSIRWYVEVVKLELEAEGIIERVPKTRPQLYRLTAPAH